MATLADSFLQDLEDLEEEKEESPDQDAVDESEGVRTSGRGGAIASASDGGITDAGASNTANGTSASGLTVSLLSDPQFVKTMAAIHRATAADVTVNAQLKNTEVELGSHASLTEAAGQVSLDISMGSGEGAANKTHGDYELVEASNRLISDLDVDLLNIYTYIRDIYCRKFPELESIVPLPLEYIATVQHIKNETDITRVDLSAILPSTVIMAVTVASSMTTGQALPASDLSRIEKAAEEAMHLADCRKAILLFLESRMNLLAPNVSAIVGTALAARLITHAGGLISLARMPAQNVMLIGSNNSSLRSTRGAANTGPPGKGGLHGSGGSVARGVIYNCDIVQNAPPAVRNRALKLVAGKVALMARVDSFHESPTGEIGVTFRRNILQSLAKAQEPPPAPTRKTLPIPDEGTRRRRGGKRYRRAKEKYGVSELRKQANRLKFGVEAEEEAGQETGNLGFGMINQGFGHGRLRLQAKQQKVLVKQQKKQQRSFRGNVIIGRGANDSSQLNSTTGAGGMTSSLVFTPMQGIELVNPGLRKPQA